MTGLAPRLRSYLSQARRTPSTSSRRLRADLPSQGDGLIGSQAFAGQRDDNIRVLVVPCESLRYGVLRSIRMLLEGSAVDEASGSPMADADHQMAREAWQQLAPVVVADEPSTFAREPNHGGLARLDGRGDLACELGKV